MIGGKATRRGLAGFLGFAAVMPGSVVSDARLQRILWDLNKADQDFAAMPDDDPRADGIIALMDLLLVRAAMIRPSTDLGFALKARIARVYGESRAGDLVRQMLLSDLMIRGRVPRRDPTEKDMLDAYRLLSPEKRIAVDRFVQRHIAGDPFDANMAALSREIPA